MSFDVQSLVRFIRSEESSSGFTRPNKGYPFTVAIEGVDGSGKSTVVALLYRLLREVPGIFVYHRVEPTFDGRFGIAVRSALTSSPLELVRLFNADRIPRLVDLGMDMDCGKKIYVQDRSFLSTCVYQSSEDVPMEFLYAAHRLFVPRPDLCFFLNHDIEVILERIRNRGGQDERFEKEEIVRKNHQKYSELYRMMGKMGEGDWAFVLDADPVSTPRDIADAIFAEIVNRLEVE